MKLQNKFVRIIILLLPLLTFIFYYPIYHSNQMSFFPEGKSEFYEVSDSGDNGNSKFLHVIQTANTIQLKYILKEGFAFPYIGFGLNVLQQNIFNNSWYDYITIRIKSNENTSLKINLITSINPQNTVSLQNNQLINECYYTAVFNCDTEYKDIKISLSDFAIPEWWLIKNNIKKHSIEDIDINNLEKFELLTSSIDSIDKVSEIKVSYIGFEKNLNLYFGIMCLFVVLLYVIIGFVYYFNRSQLVIKNAKDTIRVHINLNLGNEKERYAHTLLNYLSKNYNDPDLTVKGLAHNVHISEYSIPTLIKKYTGFSFRQYINLLRIDEAKKQLEKSDNKIIDIAFAVGYNTIAHFNKIFKRHETLSPKEYRKKHRI